MYSLSYNTAIISETTTPIDKKFQDNIRTMKMCPAMQYCDVITNPRWRTAAILKIAKSPYLSEKSSDFDKIWYTTADNEPNDSHVTFKMAAAAIFKIVFLAIIHRSSDFSEILYEEAEWHVDTGCMTKTANF